MGDTTELVTVDNINDKVYKIRGQQVMLDKDLAEIYGYEVKYLNRQVKRNMARFPEDFMFQLTKEEYESLWCQNGTLNENSKRGVDDYVNAKTLQLLSQKKVGVEVVLFTENGHGRKGFLTTTVVNDYVNEYPPLRIKPNPDCHDRLIVIDYGLSTEKVYHCGASSKDAGKKLCAINELSDTTLIHPVINRLMLGKDKQI